MSAMKTTPFLSTCAVSLSIAALATGCGGGASSSSGNTGGEAGSTSSSTAGAGTGGATGGAGGTATGGSGGTTSSSSGGAGGATGSGGGNPSADCKAALASIAEQTSGVKACTTLVRLDYQTYAIKGFHIFCDPYAATTEAAARATAQADTGFGQAGQFLSGPVPVEDEYVFWESPGDFGGAGVVSARSGKTVFGGGVVWAGAGQITYPATFQPPGLLGEKCDNVSPLPSARGWDLGGGQPLSTAQITAALDVVWGTALPDGLAQGGYLFDAVVLLYPPSVGAVDPTVAEWEVLVNSGWLE